nr:unnamed protein product [Callosobruchus analis]
MSLTDANIFQSYFLPVRLICGKDNQKVLRINPTPASARFCYPIRFGFVKQTIDVTNEGMLKIVLIIWLQLSASFKFANSASHICMRSASPEELEKAKLY